MVDFDEKVSNAFVAQEGGEVLRLFQTTQEKDLREIPTSGFTIHPYPAVEALDIDNAVEKHEFLALGASLTDASAWILANMPCEKREELLQRLFTPQGCNLGAIRLNIGASDYSTALYTYNDTEGDVEMKDFSIARDEIHLVPMAQEIKKIKDDIYFFASPWSPPAWMKTSGMLISGSLKDESMPSYANYFVKYLEAYSRHGITIDAVSPQNETMCDTKGQYPCCTYTALQEATFAKDYLAPALKKANLQTKIWLHDHDPDKEGIERVKELLQVEGVNDAIDGIAWHCYTTAEESKNLEEIRAIYPSLPFYHTENGPHIIIADRNEEWWAKKVFGMLEHGCSLFTSWNLCLDELGTPATGSHLCGGFTVVDSTTYDVSYSPQYRLFRHIGPFVKRHARILKVQGDRDGTELILFRNPDGTHVLVVVCDGSPVRKIQRHRLVIKYKGQYKTLPLPGGQPSISTLLFK